MNLSHPKFYSVNTIKYTGMGKSKQNHNSHMQSAIGKDA